MRVAGLDHVHLEVADRTAAAGWYGRILGLRPSRRLAGWAADPDGPLMLETDGGAPCLALFARDCRPPSRDATVALRIDAPGFLAFLGRLDGLGLRDRGGDAVTVDSVVDHDLAWSLYFVDADGNRLELTTYEREAVAEGFR